jgi:hypothetical protein
VQKVWGRSSSDCPSNVILIRRPFWILACVWLCFAAGNPHVPHSASWFHTRALCFWRARSLALSLSLAFSLSSATSQLVLQHRHGLHRCCLACRCPGCIRSGGPACSYFGVVDRACLHRPQVRTFDRKGKCYTVFGRAERQPRQLHAGALSLGCSLVFFSFVVTIIFLWFCCFVSGGLHCGGLYVGCGNVEFYVVSGVICFRRYGLQRETRSSRPCPTCHHWPMTKSPSRLTICSRTTRSLALNSTW